MSLLKPLRGALWKILLASSGLRRKLAYQLKANYPEDLDSFIPLQGGLVCPVFNSELGASFHEIFVEGEYRTLLEVMELPRRWVDLGSYAGFFSLWLENCRRARGAQESSEALLIDANESMAPWVRRVIERNGLAAHWKFQLGAIAPGTGNCEYIERSYMGSSLKTIDDNPGRLVSVPIVPESEILKLLAPPYDLVKVDIEGAEFELVLHYPQVLAQTRYLCLEWHSWHSGGGGVEQLNGLLGQMGLVQLKVLCPPRTIPNGNQTGVIVFHNPKL